MRTVILVFLTLTLLCGAFWVFVSVWRKPTPEQIAAAAVASHGNDSILPTTEPSDLASSGGGNVIGAGRGFHVQTLNPRTKALANEFRCDRYDPKRDGSIDVFNPEATFYLDDGRVVVLSGAKGTVRMSGASGSDPQALATQTPSSGKLEDVTIRFAPSVEQIKEPFFTITVANINFDNTTYQISTTDSVIDGKRVPADQIPVTVRGDDYEFDGSGLIAKWNDVANRLEMLEIAHGKRVLVKNPAALLPEEEEMNAPRSDSGTLHLLPREAIAAALLGEVGAGAPLQPQDESPLNASNLRQRTKEYVANFEDDVKAFSGDREIASGDLLRATFEIDPASDKTNDPNNKKKRGPKKPRMPKPDDPVELTQPLEIHWSGRLRVLPALADENSIATVARFAELTGKPAAIRRQGSEMTAATIRIEADAGRLMLIPSETLPLVTMQRADGAKMEARGLDADQTRGNALIRGPGTLFTPADPQTKQQPVDIHFSDRARIDFVNVQKTQVVSKIRIEGDVAMKQEKLDLNTKALTLTFDPSLAKPAASNPANDPLGSGGIDLASLQSILAEGDVHAVTIGKNGAPSNIDAGLLELGVTPTPDGPAIQTMRCERNVRFNSKARLLAAQTVNAKIKPMLLSATEQSSSNPDDPLDAIVSMAAEGDVLLDQGKNGASHADRMTITQDGGKRTVTLFGAPAIASSKSGAIRSTRIEVDPVTGEMRVPQAGSFIGSDMSKTGVRRDITMNWTGYLMASPRDGLATVSQGVAIHSKESTGSVLDANAGQAIVRFVASDPSTRPANGDDAFSGINIQTIETVEMTDSVKLNVDGGDQRSAVLEAPHVLYEDLTRDVIIDQPGRLLLSDLRPRDETPEPDGRKPNALSRGTLALAWGKSLRWNERSGDLLGEGGVRMGYERANDPDKLGVVQLNASRMIGKLRPVQPTPDANAQPGTTPMADAKPGGMLDSIELDSMRFEGGVTVRSSKANFDAGHIDYDASTGVASAASDGAGPVVLYAKDGISKTAVTSIRWNAITGLIDEATDISGRVIR